jgi:phage gpG-like protein
VTGDPVQVEGADRLARTLHTFARSLSSLERAEGQAARSIQLRARARAPKRTGRLASSIRADAKGPVAQVSTSLVYAGVIHNGWPAHSIRANPYLLPVAEATVPVWRPYYVAEVRDELDRVKGI